MLPTSRYFLYVHEQPVNNYYKCLQLIQKKKPNKHARVVRHFGEKRKLIPNNQGARGVRAAPPAYLSRRRLCIYLLRFPPSRPPHVHETNSAQRLKKWRVSPPRRAARARPSVAAPSSKHIH